MMFNDLMDFLTSSEAILVYVVAGISICLCFIIYIVERNNVKLRQKHNTKELNKLVSQVKEEAHIVEDKPIYDKPVLQVIDSDPEESSLSELIANTMPIETIKEEAVEVIEEPAIKEEPVIIEDVDILEEAREVEQLELEEEKPVTEELQYTNIEPNPEEAKKELEKITEELKQQEILEEQGVQNEALTSYEIQQEENAIISLEELVKKSKNMYEANELTQYADEGNEPISLNELEEKLGVTAKINTEPFKIEEVVSDEDLANVIEEEPVKEVVQETRRFKSSPIISPIYGIEKPVNETRDIQLENTANYEKLDAEIKKTNEFLMTLKDLQEKID